MSALVIGNTSIIHTVALSSLVSSLGESLAAFLVAGAFFFSAVFFSVFFSVTFFSVLDSDFLVAAAGLASFLASFTGPDGPARRVSNVQVHG